MSEIPEQSKGTAESYQDIFDALSLAFWNDDFEVCSPEAIPLVQFEDETMIECRLRFKRDYDAEHGCAVLVQHFAYTSLRPQQTTEYEYLKVEWLDDQNRNLLVSLHSLELGKYVHNEETDESEYVAIETAYFDHAKSMAKTALGVVSAI